jgi:hypothetical protein
MASFSTALVSSVSITHPLLSIISTLEQPSAGAMAPEHPFKIQTGIGDQLLKPDIALVT